MTDLKFSGFSKSILMHSGRKITLSASMPKEKGCRYLRNLKEYGSTARI